MAEDVYEQPVIPGLEALATPAALPAVELAERRQRVLEGLYWVSGRRDPAHPLHARYTGLWEQACLDVGRRHLEEILQSPQAGSVQTLLKIGSSRALQP